MITGKPIIKLLTPSEAKPIADAAIAALKGGNPDAKKLFLQQTFEAVAALGNDDRSSFLIELRELLRDNKKLKSVVSQREFNAGVKAAQKERDREICKKERDKKLGSGFPPVKVRGEHLRDVSDQGLKCLIKANDPPRIFIHGPDLSFIHVEKSEDGTRLTIAQFSPPRLKRILSRVANFDCEEPKTGMLAPPDVVVRDILHSREWEGLSACGAVVRGH